MKKQYKEPEEMIDHNSNLDTVSGLMSIFFAYNQKQVDEGTIWTKWPDWDLCLTSMKDDLHFEDEKDSDEIRARRSHWLALFQLIHENDSISHDGYTITIQGKHGNTFSFDFCLVNGCWVNTGAMSEYDTRYEKWKKDKKGKSWMSMRTDFYFRDVISHSLGPYWICPEHVPKYGGKQTVHTPDGWFCFHRGFTDSLPSELISVILLCIDDCEIWRIQFEEDQGKVEYNQRIEREWPGGRPEDYYYQ
jgi:hypothetical protein